MLQIRDITEDGLVYYWSVVTHLLNVFPLVHVAAVIRQPFLISFETVKLITNGRCCKLTISQSHLSLFTFLSYSVLQHIISTTLTLLTVSGTAWKWGAVLVLNTHTQSQREKNQNVSPQKTLLLPVSGKPNYLNHKSLQHTCFTAQTRKRVI